MLGIKRHYQRICYIKYLKLVLNVMVFKTFFVTRHAEDIHVSKQISQILKPQISVREASLSKMLTW